VVGGYGRKHRVKKVEVKVQVEFGFFLTLALT
jgi:hypothetical protein